MTTEAARTLVSIVLGSEREPGVVRWCTLPGDRAWCYDSYAVVTDEGVIAIDPKAPTAAAEQRLGRLLGETPAAIVLTSDYHERDAYALGERWGAPVWAPAYGMPQRGGEMEGEPDHPYEDGETLPGGIRALRLAGGGFAGESALTWRVPDGEGGRVVFTGDAINGKVTTEPPGRHGGRGQPGLYAAASRFHLDRCRPEELKESLRPLLDGSIAIICGAHGEPWTERASETLARLLALDWAPFFAEKRHPVVMVG